MGEDFIVLCGHDDPFDGNYASIRMIGFGGFAPFGTTASAIKRKRLKAIKIYQLNGGSGASAATRIFLQWWSAKNPGWTCKLLTIHGGCEK